MKSIQIGSIHIVLSHITHFEFSPRQKTQISAPSVAMPGYETTGEREKSEVLAVYVMGNAIKFYGQDAENGYNNLRASF